MNSFWGEFPELDKDLIEVRELLKKNVRSNEKIIEESLLELINSGGKMLRPAFLLLSGRFGNYDTNKLYPLAAVIEMLHMATLVHDDIIDDAEYRRGSRTTQSKYGKDMAVFIGDFLFCRCFMLLSNNTSMENMKAISKIVSRICIGEIQEFSSRRKTDSSVMSYLKRIQAKTAALFSLSFYIGAYESGCSRKLCSRLASIGYNIGMAFQIIDDILDCTGDAEVIGKPVANDIKDGLYTLPVIYALQTDKTELPGILKKNVYSNEDIIRILEITEEAGGVKKAGELAKKYTDKAFKLILTLPENESRHTLMKITERLLTRKF